jgi:hypothetical protein
VPTGPWLSAVYYPRACKRYYGLMRRSDELRPAWACSACSGRSLPLRAVRLTFPSLAAVYGRACPSQGLPSPESAITTRPNHPLPRQDLHLRACPSLKAAHRNLVLARRLVLYAARVSPQPQKPTARESTARQRGFEACFRINVPANFASVWNPVSQRTAELLLSPPAVQGERLFARVHCVIIGLSDSVVQHCSERYLL